MRARSRIFSTLLTLQSALGCAASPSARNRLAYPDLPVPARVVATRAAPVATPANPAPKPNPALPPTSTPTEIRRFDAAPFAGEGPLLLEASASDGSWLAVCQARKDSDGDGRVAPSFGPRGEARGDTLERFLITPGEELSIDGFLGASENARYALLLQHGALVLWDGQTGRALDLSQLGADSRLSAESFGELRTAAFDDSSQLLLYVRTQATGARVVVRDLRDDSEREFDPGPGRIWRATFAPGGTSAVLEMMTQDNDHPGRASFPVPLLAAPRACAARPGHFHTFGARGARPETVLLPLNGAPAIHEPDLLMPLGDAVLLRDASGALSIERNGKKRVIEPAPCKGRIVHADARRELFIVGCTQKKKTGRVSLELVTQSEHQPLGVELASVELDREASDSPRLVALYPGSDTALFDADKRELHALQAGDVVIATHAGHALVRRGKALSFYDVDTRAELPVPFPLDKYPDVLLALPFVFVSPVLVNLETAQVVGVSQRRPLALSRQGQLLISDGEAASSGLVSGPLRWVTPSSS